jgi:hypothetical protein
LIVGTIYLLICFYSAKDGQRYIVMRTLALKLRLMTLSTVELESITPLLHECLLMREVEAVHSAVKTGDSSKLPPRFNTSNKRRNPSFLSDSKQPNGPDYVCEAIKTSNNSSEQQDLRSPQNPLGADRNVPSGDQPLRNSNGKSSPSPKKKSHESDPQIKAEILSSQEAPPVRKAKTNNIRIKSEPVEVKCELTKTKKKRKKELIATDDIKPEPAEDAEMHNASNQFVTDQDWEVEITDQIVRVTKKRVRVKEEPKEQEQTTVAIKREATSDFDDANSVKQEGEIPAKKKRLCESSTDQNSEQESDQLWEFIETNGTIQVKRKHPKPSVENRQQQIQIKCSNGKEDSPQRSAAQATSLVHFELLQDSFQLTKTVHHVQSEAEKVILSVKVLKDLQLLGVELSARTDDSKHSNKYKKSRFEP